MTAIRHEFIAPRKFGAVESAARREFPFGFGRQFLAGPARIGERVAEGHVHDRMIVEPLEVAAGSAGWRQLAPLVNVHHWLKSRRSTACRGGVNVNEPAKIMCGRIPG